jgi:hypothetical protein
MDYLNWELTVLSRAVAFSNLSSASSNIGLSQPQLSRIISKIEKDLGVKLLDRDAKRKSAWTPIAYKLTESYSLREQQLRNDIQMLVTDNKPTHVRMATLEGLIPVAADIASKIFKIDGVQIVELSAFDLSVLEEKFLKGDYDLILTSRMPGQKKFNLCKKLGYQSLDIVGNVNPMKVMSAFEFTSEYLSRRKHLPEKICVSNSLEVRKYWIQHFGGQGTVPSQLSTKRPSKNEHAVLLVGQDQFSSEIWRRV